MPNRFFISAIASLGAVAAAQLPPNLSLPSSPSSAIDSDSRRDQIQAAVSNATTSLREQILRTPLSRDVTVNDFLDRTGSQAELTRVLKAALPVGGPRWVEDRTCQVRLELPASAVAAMLMGIAHTPGLHAPVKPDALKARFSDWNRLKFSVVGSSVGGDAIASARPSDSAGRWSQVSETARRVAIEQARADADRQLISAINSIVLNDKVRASDALAKSEISSHFNRWLAHQPVTSIDFLDDLRVSLTLSTLSVSMSTAFKAAVQSDESFTRENSIDWDQVSRQITNLPTSIVGTASVVVTATSLPAVVLPLRSPDWIDQQLQAQASAIGTGSRLKVGRAAEANAAGKIREQLLQLHLDQTTTVGDAIKSDLRIRQGVDRALLAVHTYRVEYHADGSVKVDVSLNLRDAWDELRSEP